MLNSVSTLVFAALLCLGAAEVWAAQPDGNALGNLPQTEPPSTGELSATDENASSNPPKGSPMSRIRAILNEIVAKETREAPIITMVLFLLMGGVLGLYIRFLYRHCNGSVTDADSVARIFPLLTMVTIGVIAVVKSSLALSLGLVGALSIVRFRAAIKDPEELVYLFLCIGVGLALGAEQPLLALALVGVATVFVLGLHVANGKSRRQNLLLTISGEAKFFEDGPDGVLAAVDDLAGGYVVQRFDIEGKRGQLRIVVNQRGGQDTATLISRLRERLPKCEFSYVNLETTF